MRYFQCYVKNLCSRDNPNILSSICMIFDHRNQLHSLEILNITLQPSWHVGKWIYSRYPLWSTISSPSPFRFHVMVPKVNLITKDKKKHTPYLRSRLTTPSLSFECFRRKRSIFAVTQNHPLPTFLSSFGKSLFFLVTTGLNRRRRDVSAPLDNNSVANFVFSNYVWEFFGNF